MQKFPVVLTKDGKEDAQCDHSADLQGWLKAGWKLKLQATKSAENSNDSLTGLSDAALLEVARKKKVDPKGLDRDQLIKKIRG